jgi:hypothetical protein
MKFDSCSFFSEIEIIFHPTFFPPTAITAAVLLGQRARMCSTRQNDWKVQGVQEKHVFACISKQLKESLVPINLT